MAEAYFNHFARLHGYDMRASSAGTMSSGELNAHAVQVMAEDGVDMSSHVPKTLTQELAEKAQMTVSMGCGVNADACPAKLFVSVDWNLDDPAGQGIDEVRRIRDQVRTRVIDLLQHIPSR